MMKVMEALLDGPMALRNITHAIKFLRDFL